MNFICKKIAILSFGATAWVGHAQTTGETDSPGAASERPTPTIVIRDNRTLSERFMGTGSRVIVGRQDIEQMGADTVTDVLKQLPGVQVQGEGSGNVSIRMRGMNANATQVLIDGQRATQARSAAQLPLDQLPADMIERIEVIRSPTAEFSGASAGTINIVLRQSSTKRETTIRLTDQIVWGQHAPMAFFSRTGPVRDKDNDDPRDQPWAYSVSAYAGEKILGGDSTRKTSLYGSSVLNSPLQTTVREQNRVRNQEAGVSPRLNGRAANGDQIGLRMNLSAGETRGLATSDGVGTNSLGAVRNLIESRPDSTKATFDVRGDHSTRFASVKLDTYLSGQMIKESISRTQQRSSTTGGVSSQSASEFSDDRTERAFTLSTKLTNTDSEYLWLLGAELESRRFALDNRNTDAAFPNFKLDTVFTRQVLWGQNEWGVHWLPKTASTLSAGLRFERLELDSRYQESTGTPVNQTIPWDVVQPSLHLRTPIDTSSQWRMNLARVGRNPRVTDLLARTTQSQGLNSPTNPHQAGNPLLRSETSVALDAGIEQRLGGASSAGGQAGLSLFLRNVHDVHGQRVTSDPSGTVWTRRPENMGAARVWGVEVDVKTSLKEAGFDAVSSDWSLSASATTLYSKMQAPEFGGNRVPGQARYLANLGVAKPMRRTGGWFGGAYLNLQGNSDEVTSVPGAASGVANGGSNKGYATLNGYVGSVVPQLGFWRLGVFNLTNAARDQTRTTTSATHDSLETSETLLSRRLFLTVGTQF